MTRPQREALEKAYEARRKEVEGEKGKRLNIARGVGALKLASALAASGDPYAARSKGLAGLAETASEYTKEEARIRDKLSDADLAQAQARVAMAQGDMKLGAELAGNAQKLRIEAAKVVGDNAYKRMHAELEAAGMPSQIAVRWATRQKELAHANVLIPSQATNYYAQARLHVAQAAAAKQKGAITPVQLDGIYNKARSNAEDTVKDPRSLLALQKQYPGLSTPQIVDAETIRLYNESAKNMQRLGIGEIPLLPPYSRVTNTPPNAVAGKLGP